MDSSLKAKPSHARKLHKSNGKSVISPGIYLAVMLALDQKKTLYTFHIRVGKKSSSDALVFKSAPFLDCNANLRPALFHSPMTMILSPLSLHLLSKQGSIPAGYGQAEWD
jgi:hypothetical protein